MRKFQVFVVGLLIAILEGEIAYLIVADVDNTPIKIGVGLGIGIWFMLWFAVWSRLYLSLPTTEISFVPTGPEH